MRHRSALVAVVLMAAFGPAASGVTGQSQVRLTETVDENWRGAYDILVRPDRSRSSLEAKFNLVEPNFLMFTGEGGISLGELADVRDIEGVELAAPVSMVGYVSLDASTPVVHLSNEIIPAEPTLYQLGITTLSSDGYSEVTLDEQIHHIVPLPEDQRRDRRWHSGSGDTQFDQDTFVDFDPVPAVASPIIAVDPVSERQLLGPSADFLAAFGEVGGRREVATFPIDLIPDDYSRFREYVLIVREETGFGPPMIPILASQSLYAPLRVEMTIEQLGDPIEMPLSEGYSYLESATSLREDAEPTPIGTVSIDATGDLKPFQSIGLVLEWPGSDMPGGATYSSGFFVQEFTAALSQPLAFEERPSRQSSDAISLGAVPTDEGFRSPESTTIGEAPDLVATPRDFPFLLAPIGEYDLGDLDLPNNPLNWVPIGAFEAPATSLVADATGVPVDPVPMNPTFDPSGLLQPPPLAITDLQSAKILRGGAPIDAIRVRVGGITGFDAVSQARVERVATSIEDLGLDVDIVAGSSPQPVELYWPSYYPDGSDLGWVEQRWSTLGAAQEVTSGLSQLNRSILVVAVITAIAGVIGLQITRSVLRRQEAEALRTVGWTLFQTVRWLSADGVVGGLIVAGVGVVVWRMLGLEPAALSVVLLVAAVFAGSSVAGALSTVSRLNDDSRSGRAVTRRIARTPRPEGMMSYAVRALLARPVSSLAAAVSLAVVSGGVSLILVSTLGAASEAGPTLLAEFGVARLRGYQMAMLAITAVAGLGTYSLLLRHDISKRRGELAALRSMGLRTKTIRGLLLRQRVLIGFGAAIVAALIGFGFVTDSVLSLWTGLLAAAVALFSTVWAAPTANLPKP